MRFFYNKLPDLTKMADCHPTEKREIALGRNKRVLFISGFALVLLLVIPLLKMITNALADQSTNPPDALVLTRSIADLSGTDISGKSISKGQQFYLNYSITPQDFSLIADTQQVSISDIVFNEQIPSGVSVVTLPSGFTNQGNNFITANLGTIRFKLDSSKSKYTADLASNSKFASGKYTFSILVTSQTKATYTFDKATLNYSDVQPLNGTGSPNGLIGDYSLVILNDGSITGGSSIYGNMAFGGNLSLTNKSGGLYIPGNILIGKNFTYLSQGSIQIGGNVIYGDSFVYDQQSRSAISGTVTQAKPVDFSAVSNYWTNKSAALAALTPNGTSIPMQYNADQLALTASSSNLSTYIFTITEAQIKATNGILITAPVNATIIMNILGEFSSASSPLTMNKWVVLNNSSVQSAQATKIIYNFPQAQNIKFTQGMIGTIIAPKANVSITNGDYVGSLLVNSWLSGSYSMSLTSKPFTGTIPGTKNFGAVSITLTDVDTTPRTLSIGGNDVAAVSEKVALTTDYSPKTDTGIIYTWTVTDNGTSKDVTSSVLAASSGTSTNTFSASYAGDFTVKAAAKNANNLVTTATKIISVRKLEISGPDTIFIGKTKDYQLTMGNIPSGSAVTWSLTGNSGQTDTLIRASGDTNYTHYTLTAGSQPHSVVISVTAGGITATKMISIVPYSLTGLQAVSEIEINVGQAYNLNDLLYPIPNEMDRKDFINDLSWVSGTPGIADFDKPLTDPARRGVITGLQKGETIVTVTYTPSGKTTSITAQIKVKVLAPKNGDLY
ncbi:collagen-binding domain-containing protein [Paenibacillus pinistramenti]|uniref:collagen-binding domain-containing protein n=1 Tax=Paenibacillus pinistramenti TaxID=1768003 RepID=UPI001108CFD6|nr:collagen-binding domain-containing protein [Paenibacillus pinistramenti]